MQSIFIKTLDEVMDHLPVQMTSDILTLDPFFATAERSIVKNLIGKNQLNAFALIYADAQGIIKNITDQDTRLAVMLCQKITTYIGYHLGWALITIKIGTSGATIVSNQDTKQAFQWQVDGAKQSLLELAYNAIEELLQLLEESPDKFSEYINSPEYIASEQYLIESASDFDQYFRINRSRYIFISINYIMRRIESDVKKLYGREFFESLKSDNQTGKYKILIDDYIKPGIALLTAQIAIIERVITFQNGVASINLMGNYDSVKANIPATRDEVKAASEQLSTAGSQFLQDGLEFIKENGADFPDFVLPTRRKRYNVTNNPDAGILAI